MADIPDDDTARSRPAQPEGDGTILSRRVPPLGDGTLVSQPIPPLDDKTVASGTALPDLNDTASFRTVLDVPSPPQYPTIQADYPGQSDYPAQPDYPAQSDYPGQPEFPPPPVAAPPKKKSRMLVFGCGCLALVIVAGGIGAFLAMRGKGHIALPFFGAGTATIRGTIYDPSHAPLHAGQIQVVVHSTAGGKTNDLTAVPGADGHYTIAVPKGPCTVESSLTIAPNGKSLTIPLAASPAAGAADCTADSVRDFQWQLTGVRPGADPAKDESHLGAMVSVSIDPTHFSGPSHLTIHFTPTGPLVDGSTGTPVTVEKATDDPTSMAAEVELPLGSWGVDASSTGASGQPEPLLIGGQSAVAIDLLQAGSGSLTQLQLDLAQPQLAATATAPPADAVPPPPPPPPPPVHHAAARKPAPPPAKKPVTTSTVQTSDQTEVNSTPTTTSTTSTSQDQKPQQSRFKKTMSAIRDKFRSHPKTDTSSTSTSTSTQSPPR